MNRMVERAGFGWVSQHELKAEEFPPANRIIVDLLTQRSDQHNS